MKELEKMLSSVDVPRINPDRNYWLVRTNKGDYYQDFCNNSYIGLGWDEINDLDLIKEGDFEKIKAAVSEGHPDEKRPGNVSRQLYRFVKEMKKGDVVLIPSQSSSFVTFGELLDDEIYLESPENLKDLNNGSCHFIKRRRVQWLVTKNRSNIDPYLYKLLNSHYGLTTAKQYEHYIDRTLYSFFIKDKNAHLIFEVGTEEKIRAIDLVEFFSSTLACIDIYNEITGFDYRKEDIDIKINVQSPGPIEFSGYSSLIVIIAVLGVVFAGGKLRIIWTKDKKEGELSTEGLLDAINRFLTQRNKDQITIKKLEAKLKMTHRSLELKQPTIVLLSDETKENEEEE